MRSPAIVDSGPLVAALDPRERSHALSAAALRRSDLHLVIPALVVAEVAYFAQQRYGSRVESAFVRGLEALDVQSPTVEEWPLIAGLVDRYADFPLGTADASVIVLADRLGTDLIVTLDRRHFGAVQSPQGRRFRLLPEPTSIHDGPAVYETATS
jgi:uncharacterized protein